MGRSTLLLSIERSRRQIRFIGANTVRAVIADVVTGKLDVREAAPKTIRMTSVRSRFVTGLMTTGNLIEGGERMDWENCPAVERKPGKL